MGGSIEEGIQKLRVWLRGAGVSQVDECETDYDVLVLTVRVTDAMTKAYKTVSDMLETAMHVAENADDVAERQATAERKASERAAQQAMRKQRGGGGRGRRRG